MRNRFEGRVWAALPAQFEYEALALPYVIAHGYTPDFVDRANHVMVEAKGLLTDVMRRKYLAVAKQNPAWELVFCFQNPQRRISKRSKTTYAEWARRHGFRVMPPP